MSNPDVSAYVQHILESAPPLSDEKRDQITTLFNGVIK